jgi:hypothetical protein
MKSLVFETARLPGFLLPPGAVKLSTVIVICRFDFKENRCKRTQLHEADQDLVHEIGLTNAAMGLGFTRLGV